MTQTRLVLWDVDGTLLRGGSVAREALEIAVARALGRRAPADDVQMSGKTDPLILDEIAARAGVPERERPAVVGEALGHLADAFAALADRFGREGRLMPGVPALLERLHARSDVLQTLLTGNIAPNGRAKVAAFGLDAWLDLEAGAFGSDDSDRTRLVPLALRRAAARLGGPIDPACAWVVGDTPRDLACARAGGVRCLLVATGRYRYDALTGLGADAVVEDLSRTGAVEALLLGAATPRCPDAKV